MRKPIISRLFFLTCLLVWLSATADAQFVVRTIYFQPTSAPPPTAQVIDLMLEVQNFYQFEIERHGYGPKTFRLETDGNDNVGIHHIKGQHPAFHYLSDTYNQLLKELPNAFKR